MWTSHQHLTKPVLSSFLYMHHTKISPLSLTKLLLDFITHYSPIPHYPNYPRFSSKEDRNLLLGGEVFCIQNTFLHIGDTDPLLTDTNGDCKFLDFLLGTLFQFTHAKWQPSSILYKITLWLKALFSFSAVSAMIHSEILLSNEHLQLICLSVWHCPTQV